MVIIQKMVTKISRLPREKGMVGRKNERHREKIIVLSKITKEKIVVWYVVELPAFWKRLDSLTFKRLSYS